MYPGCIAETNLFREKRQWFKTIFPLFMKYVTGGYVPEAEAGQRLAQVIDDPECDKQSGVYWSWNGNAQQVPTTTLDLRHMPSMHMLTTTPSPPTGWARLARPQ